MATKANLRIRVSEKDVHYPDSLAPGAYVLGLFGDVATELLIRQDGDCGLFRAYDNIEFLAPVRAGDYLEVEGEITHVGNTSRKMSFVARKVIQPCAQGPHASSGEVLKEPVIVVKATGTCVVPKDYQRNSPT